MFPTLSPSSRPRVNLQSSVHFSGTLEEVKKETQALQKEEAQMDGKMIKGLLARKLVTLNDRQLTGLEILDLVNSLSEKRRNQVVRRLILPNLLVGGLGLIHPVLFFTPVLSSAITLPWAWKRSERTSSQGIQSLVHRPQDLSLKELWGALRLLRAAGLVALTEATVKTQAEVPALTCRLTLEGQSWLATQLKAKKAEAQKKTPDKVSGPKAEAPPAPLQAACASKPAASAPAEKDDVEQAFLEWLAGIPMDDVTQEGPASPQASKPSGGGCPTDYGT